MAKITPVINGELAPIHGSFIIGPDGEGSLDLDGYRVHFRFGESAGESSVDLESGNNEMTLTLHNASSLGAALDLSGFNVDGRPMKLHLSFVAIGSDKPHRVITYTMSAA